MILPSLIEKTRPNTGPCHRPLCEGAAPDIIQHIATSIDISIISLADSRLSSILVNSTGGILLDIDDLHRQSLTGDKQQEKRLFEFLAGRFRLIARHSIRNRDDAAEVAQNALMAVTENYRTAEVRTSFAAWSNSILRNKIVDYYRALGRSSNQTVSMDDSTPEPIDPPQDSEMRRRLLDCLKYVRKVNVQFGRVLVLHYQGFRTAEVCRKLNVSSERLYKILFRARAALRTCLNDGAPQS